VPSITDRGLITSLAFAQTFPRSSPDAYRASACGRCPQGKRGAHAQGLGRSRGGLSTKIHAGTDALGLPVRLIAGPGQQNDAARGEELIEGLEAGAVLADKGYDSNQLRQKIEDQGSKSSFRRESIGKSLFPTIKTSTRSAMPWNASSTNSSISGVLPPDTISSSSTSSVSSNWPLSHSG